MNFNDVEEIKPDNKDDTQFHFYYNREERIKNAPQIVQEYYNGGMRPVRGFKIFFTKQNRYIFLALIFFVGASLIYTGLNKTRAYTNINSILFELSAFEYDEQVFISIKIKNSQKIKEPKPRTIQAEIFVIDPNNQVGDKQLLFHTYVDGEEYMRTKFTDFDITRVDVNISIGDEQKEISTIVKR